MVAIPRAGRAAHWNQDGSGMKRNGSLNSNISKGATNYMWPLSPRNSASLH